MFIDFQITHPQFSQCFTTDFCGPELLSEAEKSIIERASAQRVSHFSTGRYCAKQALKQVGIANAEILMSEDKQPLWPEGIVGSISHTKNMVGAVVADAGKLVSIGLDIETIGGVKPDMWDMLYLQSEQEWLNTFSGEELAFYTTLLFSGKEAFYKFQHPITKTFLDFTDVGITVDSEQLQLRVIIDFPGKELLPKFTPIKYTRYEQQVITLCYQQ